MGKNFRKRKADTDDEGEEEETAEERRKRLADLKAEQEARQKKKGVEASKLLGAKLDDGKRGAAAADGEGEDEGELKDTFYTEHIVEASEDPHMLKYIEEKLAEKRGAKQVKQQEAEPAKPDDGRIREEDLYTTPDYLKVETTEAGDTADRWLTGIIEVALPTDYRIKNMEETERAKQDLLMKQIKKGETEALERMGIYKKPEMFQDDRISRGALPRAFGKGGARKGPPTY